jgi:dipeptidyl aminopeptidase/acylaminoacyl peptidase
VSLGLATLAGLSLGTPGAAWATPPGYVGRIAFAAAGDIATMTPAGGDMKLLSSGEDFVDDEPAFSPGGARIAFTREDGFGPEIWVMNANGSGKMKLADGRSPCWSPDAKQIAFVADSFGTPTITVMDADGANATPITAGDRPDWSPDGQKIAFTTGTGDAFGIYAMAPNGANQTKVATGIDPSWSPDSQRLAFAKFVPSGLGGVFEIAAVNADGTGEVPLTTGGSHHEHPAWSPDGMRIAYQLNTRALDWAIVVMNADGSGQKTLKGEFETEYRTPDWQAPSVALTRSAAVVRFGKQVTLSAHLFWFDSTTNDILSLFAIPIGGTKNFIADLDVSEDNLAAIATRPTKKTNYVAEWSGDESHGAGTNSIIVLVRALTKTKLSGFYATSGRYKLFHAGRSVTQTGTVIPNHAGSRLEFVAERRVNSRWRSFASARFRIQKNGSVTASIVPPPGRYRVRNRFEGDGDHVGSSSTWRYLQVVS